MYACVNTYGLIEAYLPISIDGDVIETVSSFCYLESIMEGCGGVALEVNTSVARVCGAL